MIRNKLLEENRKRMIYKRDQVEVIDNRPTPADNSIPMDEAVIGELYETKAGLVVLCIGIPADSYKNHVTSRQVAFLHSNGLAYPCTSDRIWPLEGSVVWHVTNGGRNHD